MMGGLIGGPTPPSQLQPQPVQQPVMLEPETAQRDVSQIDKLRRRKQQASLFDLLQEGSDSPTIL